MNYIFLLLLTLAQILIGYAILSTCNVHFNKKRILPLSLLTGIGVVSVVPFILDLVRIPLTAAIIFSVIAIITILLTILSFKKIKDFKFIIPTVELYEVPWLLVILATFILGLYNALSVPVTPRDVLCGPEPIAEFALTEHTFINSAFEREMPLNNGPFKSIFIPSLQLIYKLIGFSYGKIWVTITSATFLLYMYYTLSSRIHAVLSGFFILLLLFVTEAFAYTYLVLYDYSNMIFYFLSLYFIKEHLNNSSKKNILLASLFMCIATYIRAETLVLAGIVVGYLFLHKVIKKQFSLKDLLPIVALFVATAITYFITSNLWLNHYLPVVYDVSGEVNNNLLNLNPLLTRLNDITFTLIYSEWGITHYGYIFSIFTLLLIAELAIYRKLSKDATYWIVMFLLTYLGIAVVGYLLPLADLFNSTKRAIFKLLPIMLIYFSCNQLILMFTEKLNKFTAEKLQTAHTNSKKKKRK